MPYTDAPELTNVADYTDTTGPADYDASYRDTGFPGFKKLRRAARGAVSQVQRAAVRGVPAVAQLMRAPDLLQKTQSAAGAVALRTLRKADPSAYLETVKSGARLLASRPEFNAAISGAKLIPGVGSAVSSGLAAAAALGQGESLEDAAIAAAREGLATNPATAFAFDTAVGLAKGGDLPDAAIEAARGQIPGGAAGKAAFDAGLALARRGSMDPDMVQAVRSGLAGDGDTGAFDDLISRASRVMRRDQLPDFPGLNTAQVQAARAMMTLPRLRRMRVRDAAGELGIGTRETQEAIAACCNHLGNTSAIDWSDVGDLETAEEAAVRLRVVKSGQAWDRTKKIRPANHAGARRIPRITVSRKWAMQLGKMGGPAVQSALIRHGILARIAGDTGELTGPTAWTIRTGDFPSGIAKKLTGNGGRWKELLAVNPGMTTYTDSNGATQIKPWAVGQSVNVPPAWVGATTTTTTPGTPAPPAAPPTTATSSSGGPPFPAPSKYPNGYPGATYTVQAGDFGTKIAETITGNGSRWRELLVLNPEKGDDGTFGLKIFAGDVLKLPSTWQAMAAPPAKVPAGPPAIPVPGLPPGIPTPVFPGLPPSPVGAPPGAQAVVATAQQIAIVQAMLVTFHGKHPDAGFLAPYGATRYGGQGDDLSGTWSQRSQVALASFERWWNTKGKQPPVAQDGYPDEAAVAALQRQTSDDINVPVPGTEIPAVAGGMTPPTQTAPASSSSSSSGAGPAIAALLGAYALFG